MAARASALDLSIASSGLTLFTAHYDAPGTRVVFPMMAAPLDSLVFSGPAGFVSASPDDALLSTPADSLQARLVGRRVVVAYTERRATRQVEGVLLQSDADTLAVDTGAALVSVKRDAVLSVSAAGVTSEPTLQLRLAAPDRALVVSGRDTMLSFRASHSVVLSPRAEAGAAEALLATHATVFNNYAWDIDVRALTLVEQEEQARASVEMAAAQAPRSAAPAPALASGVSGQSGAVALSTPVRLSRSPHPTVIAVATQRLADARWHLLGELDPADGAPETTASLDFVVRLGRSGGDFMLSGPAAVHIDMDPEDGDDHVAATPLSLGFYYNAWDATNAQRMYYRMGATALVAVRTEAQSARDEHDDAANKHVVYRRVTLANRTPYNAVCKLYVRSQSYQRVLTAVAAAVPEEAQRVRVTPFVPELPGERTERSTWTLTVAVPPSARAFVVDLRAEYYTQA